MELIPAAYDFAALTTDKITALIDGSRPVVVLLPVGSVEPHGPHLPLSTDTVISHGAAVGAARLLEQQGLTPLIAPAVPYGVTECAARFGGAVTVSPVAVSVYLRSVVEGFLANRVAHVCLINNHLEPAHDQAVRSAIEGLPLGRASVASPLARRWARTLSDEFKSGECHAGTYETSIVMAARPELVDEKVSAQLPEVPVSLSRKLSEGISDFVEMGLTRAYSGSPADATSAHGDEQLALLATMIATEVIEALEE